MLTGHPPQPLPVAALLAAANLALGMALGMAAASPARAAASAKPAFTARGSAEQVQVTGARPRAPVALLGPRRGKVASKRADSLGGVVFRAVRPGGGYRVIELTHPRASSGAVTVISPRSAPPSTAIYHQRIPTSGYGYLRTRDGTTLAIDVHAPPGRGPYPTLIEYSGYAYANPQGGQESLAPLLTLLGFAVVDVNMRGTGCSGGAFDYFERLQALDGYDVIETVARQPWVLHHEVGMTGISYGGISQLFVAATDPPHLAAITPLSVIDDSATTTYPGGILNTGFAVSWVRQRVHDAEPASSTGGQAWALTRIRQGDTTCRANQVLHGAALNLLAKIAAYRYYVPAVSDPLAPVTFVHRIKVPVFLACQFTDEQTGGHCPALASHFTGTRRKWLTFTNGTHIDALDPATATRWYDFLELYVARRAPKLPALVRDYAPTIFQAATGVPGLTLPPDPIEGRSYAAARAAFERLPPVRVLFDNGAGSGTLGAPVAAFEHSFARWPVPGAHAQSWYLDAGGALVPTAPAAAGTNSFIWKPAARPATSFTGDTSSGPGGLWTATPRYNWTQNPPGTALSYLTAPLSADTVVIGGGAVQVWLRSSAPRVDLQATVSEVRPDGREAFVQNGWLDTSERKLDPRKSTLLAPVPTFRRADLAALAPAGWTEVTVPLYYEGHAYRAGSRIRITIAGPGGDQPVWAFADSLPGGAATVSLAYGQATPSRLVLPVVDRVPVPTPLPPCPGLRGEPCRGYQALVNG